MPNLEGGELLNQIETQWPHLGVFLRTKVLPAINQTAQNAAVAPVGEVEAPSRPDSVSVKVLGDYLHVAVSDNNTVQKNTNYFTEVSNNPQFSQPIVYHHGTSRTPPPFPLPTFQDDGTTKHDWYVRSYSQLPGSQPSQHTYHGGDSPVAVQMDGTATGSLLASTGSGTAPTNGQSGGSGFGKVLIRPPATVKRTV